MTTKDARFTIVDYWLDGSIPTNEQKDALTDWLSANEDNYTWTDEEGRTIVPFVDYREPRKREACGVYTCPAMQLLGGTVAMPPRLAELVHAAWSAMIPDRCDPSDDVSTDDTTDAAEVTA